MRYLFIIFLVFSLTAEEDKPNPMPIEAQKIVNVLNMKICELQKQAAKDLKKVQDAQTKANNLDAALAVRDAISDLEKLVNDATPSILGEVSNDTLVLGKWRIGNGTLMTIQQKGIATISSGATGTWSIKDKQLVVKWDSGWVDLFDISDKDKDKMTGTYGRELTGNRLPLSATREKP